MPIYQLLNSINEIIYLFLGQNIAFFMLLFLIIILSFLLEKIWIKILQKSYPYLLIPGVAIHELSHLLACYLTRAKVYRTKIISRRGGYIEHGKSKIPIIGSIIISFAPIVGGIISVFIVIFLLDFPVIIDKYFLNLLLILVQSWQFWLGFYLITAILITLIPSWQDLKNSFIALFFVLALFLLLEKTGINIFNLFNYPALINIFSSVIIIQVTVFLLSLPLYFLGLVIRR